MISRMVTELLLLLPSVGAVSSAPITPDEVRVIGDDTIRIGHQRPDVRLAGFNAPETRRAIRAKRSASWVTRLLDDFAILFNRAILT